MFWNWPSELSLIPGSVSGLHWGGWGPKEVKQENRRIRQHKTYVPPRQPGHMIYWNVTYSYFQETLSWEWETSQFLVLWTDWRRRGLLKFALGGTGCRVTPISSHLQPENQNPQTSAGGFGPSQVSSSQGALGVRQFHQLTAWSIKRGSNPLIISGARRWRSG